MNWHKLKNPGQLARWESLPEGSFTIQTLNHNWRGTVITKYELSGPYITPSLFNTLEAAQAQAEAGSKPAPQQCQWFLHCENPATTTQHHPILGDLHVCDRCKKFASA